MRQLPNLFSASPLLLARLVGAGAGFLTQIILARLLSAEDLGTFFAVTSFAAVAGLVVTQGYPGVAQRFIARYREQGRERLLQGFVSQAERETVLITLAVITIVTASGLTWPGLAFDARLVFAAAALCIADASAFTIYGAFASVEPRFALAQLPETLVRPLFFLPAVLIVPALGFSATAGAILVCYAGLSALLALAQYALLAPTRPATRTLHYPRLARHWRREGRTLALYQDSLIRTRAPNREVRWT